MFPAADSASTTTAPALPAQRRQLPWALLPILFAGLLLRLWQLVTVTCSFDEACSLRISTFPLAEMFDAIGRDAHPPVFYLLLKGWGAVFGPGLLVARLFGVCCGVLGLVLAWLLVEILLREKSKENGGQYGSIPLLAAALLALDPLHIRLSQEARPYSWGVCLALLGAICLLRAVGQPARLRWWVGATVALGLLSMTHYYGLLTVGALLVWGFLEAALLARRPEMRRAGYQIAAGMALVLAGLHLIWFPWFATFEFQQGRAYHQLWMPPLDFWRLVDTCWKAVTTGHAASPGSAISVWVFGLWIVASVILIARGGRAGRLLGIAALAPLLLAVGYSIAVRNIMGVRYLVFGQVFLLLGMAWLLGVMVRWPPLRMVGLVLLGLWCSGWSLNLVAERSARAAWPKLRQAVADVEVEAGVSPIIVSSPFLFTMCQVYAERPERWHLQYAGDHRNNILSGPALRASDYESTTGLLAARPEVIWAVDQVGMFQESSRVRVPVSYELIEEEPYGDQLQSRVTFWIRTYRRRDEVRRTERLPAK